MPRLLPGVGTLVLVSAIAAAAQGDEFDDFRIPAHHQVDWAGSFAASGSRTSSDYQHPFGNGAGRGRNIGGSTSSQFSWLADSDPSLASVTVDFSVAGGRGWSSSRSFVDQSPLASMDFQNSSANRSAAESWRVSASFRRYPWVFPLGLSLSLQTSGNYGQGWSHQEDWSALDYLGTRTVSLSRRRAADWQYRHNSGVSAGLGLGRVRDATAVYELHLLEQRLAQAGALTRPLSPPARRQLAGLFYLRGSYGGFRDRPGRFLWKDIERVLRDDGALSAEGLDGHAVLRAGEPAFGGSGSGRDGLPSSPIGRLRGFFVGVVLTDFHEQALARHDESQFRQDVINDTVQAANDQHVGTRFERHFDQVLAGPMAEYHRPLGDRWQVDFAGRALVPTRKEDESWLQVMNNGTVTALLADRWLVRFYLWQTRVVRRHSTAAGEVTDSDDWAWSYGAAWTHYLEDRLSLQLTVSETQQKHGSFQYSNHQRGAGLSLGLTYRFLGRYQAPGILEPANIAGGS